MVNQGTGEGTAVAGDGAAGSQSSNTEVAELRTQLEAANALVTERDTELVTANKSVEDLQAANKKFADDAVGLVAQGKQLTDAQSALEESRKTSTTLTTQLEEANTRSAELLSGVLTRRRQDLTSKFGLPEERVADLDDAGLSVLESTLPHVPQAANVNGFPPSGGLGLTGGSNDPDVSKMSDSDRALRMIERLKQTTS